MPENRRRVLLPEQRHLLETFAGQIALAIERAVLAESADKAKLSAEREALRNTLLASISHDLRTPLAVISAASSTLSDSSLTIDAPARQALLASISTKSKEMEQLVSNVLDLMRFETGPVSLRLDWESLDDLLGAAIAEAGGAAAIPRDQDAPPGRPAAGARRCSPGGAGDHEPARQHRPSRSPGQR